MPRVRALQVPTDVRRPVIVDESSDSESPDPAFLPKTQEPVSRSVSRGLPRGMQPIQIVCPSHRQQLRTAALRTDGQVTNLNRGDYGLDASSQLCDLTVEDMVFSCLACLAYQSNRAIKFLQYGELVMLCSDLQYLQVEPGSNGRVQNRAQLYIYVSGGRVACVQRHRPSWQPSQS